MTVLMTVMSNVIVACVNIYIYICLSKAVTPRRLEKVCPAKNLLANVFVCDGLICLACTGVFAQGTLQLWSLAQLLHL